MPTEIINLSLAAHLRYDPDNMIIWLLIPASMSADSQLKYFKYLAKEELNPLSEIGVPGPDGPVKIKLFGAALDLKGKEKFYNQAGDFPFTISHSLFAIHYFSFTISHSLFPTTGGCHGVLRVQHMSGSLRPRPWWTNPCRVQTYVAGRSPAPTAEAYVPRRTIFFPQHRDERGAFTENNTNSFEA